MLCPGLVIVSVIEGQLTITSIVQESLLASSTAV